MQVPARISSAMTERFELAAPYQPAGDQPEVMVKGMPDPARIRELAG